MSFLERWSNLYICSSAAAVFLIQFFHTKFFEWILNLDNKANYQ